MRLACLDVPAFPLQAAAKAHPELRRSEAPWAVHPADALPARTRLTAVSRAAALRGVRCGAGLPQARAICPELLLVPLSELAFQAAAEALLAAARTLSPEVEAGGPGIVFVAVDRVARLHGGEEQMAIELRQVARRMGFEAKVAVASSRLAARAAARHGSGVELVPPGSEPAYLAPLPLSLLALSPEVASTLDRWGLRTLADLSRLPREDLGARLGPEGVRIHRLASGEEVEPWQPLGQLEETVERVELEWGATQVEQLLFAAKLPLERLIARLGSQGLLCSGLSLRLSLDPHGFTGRELELAAPSRDVLLLLTLLRSLLERQPPEAPVIGLRLTAHPARARPEQHGLFSGPSVSPEELGAALGRVEALVGSGHLGSPTLLDTHLPTEGNCVLTRFSPRPPPNPDAVLPVLPAAPNSQRQASLRLFRPPRVAEVLVERDRLSAVRAENLGGRVVDCAGPWPVEAGWWSSAAAALDCYDVTLSDGGAYRMAFDHRTGRWLVQGEYD
jgi:protein ImuB